ncbi:MAG: MotA/TolQ/ExbB proton channel family protein [Zymomonas mobilis subsp. pomaceae]|uniref:MotA/TolQ/ExbB proton channel n=1 Tax=Zymomonas mobilis subsp. pomaceae (strain ATCC 29192 / DSM 22645 / JCM 10191 / CCUG 17912 / NBRC 13757 / NCIMB 11200 / NRRL B-4491 / Barker I) TaxID=579138 RepID=F8ERQ0_ZYMMT|nr:MotA/TolQ/ExbB proton channel family protein [Zymomonas mobilis]AEI37508.1 MotA/TolQ/ExbB proton channel [Zymomonas mobilis subsp. pomaceae ATCC 29192]MDX5948876.1 MotA/TolQ/ExbB proton channel family protein [Zymomonas mobilis subsp. pomaceae]GEB88683.1 hypothetical protein ZMO02_03200 [Zymomonas mobilis subsp. pomaceae]
MYLLTSVSHFFDATAFFLVFIGAFAIAIFRSTLSDLLRVLKAFVPLIKATPERDGEVAAHAVQSVLRQVQAKGIATADRVDIAFAPRFVQQAVNELTDCTDPEIFHQWTVEQIRKRQDRHQGAINFWHIISDVAPSVAMIGTVIGLVNMFSHLDDINTLGPSMAMAILTTLYGLCLSTLIAVPIAGRLEYLSDMEGRWWQNVADNLVLAAMGELAPVPARIPLLRVDQQKAEL